MKADTPSRKRLLKAREAMAQLGLSRDAFYHLVHEGQLRIVQFRPGSKWFIDQQDLDRLVETSKTSSPSM